MGHRGKQVEQLTGHLDFRGALGSLGDVAYVAAHAGEVKRRIDDELDQPQVGCHRLLEDDEPEGIVFELLTAIVNCARGLLDLLRLVTIAVYQGIHRVM